jgi:hypothetical protein
LENDDLLNCILLTKQHSLTTNYGGFVSKFFKNTYSETRVGNSNTREAKIINKFVQNMASFASVSEKIYNKLPKSRI